MNNSKITFALFFGNRGFFPGEVIADARKEMIEAVKKNGFDYISMDENITRYGAVETRKEGQEYAKFLEENKGKFDGVILCMPNFSDENGAAEALKEANVPVWFRHIPTKLEKWIFQKEEMLFAVSLQCVMYCVNAISNLLLLKKWQYTRWTNLFLKI